VVEGAGRTLAPSLLLAGTKGKAQPLLEFYGMKGLSITTSGRPAASCQSGAGVERASLGRPGPIGQRIWVAPISVAGRTDIDGRYEFKGVQGGDYYVFGSYSIEYSYIDWLIPATVNGPDTLKIDLYNGTARCIENKKE
jgi:hypothetical protein